MKRVLQHWEEKTKVAADDEWMNEKTKTIFIEILEIQRVYLTEVSRDPKVNEEIIREQLYQFDLEEERLKTI